MSDNKKQHFVPKYALRHFASDNHITLNERKQIDLINIKRKNLIRKASLRDQCYRDFLYGKSLDMEKSLGQIESQFSPLVNNIVDNDSIPSGAITKTNIAFMICLQNGRTLVAEEEINFIANKFMRLVMYGRMEKKELEQIEISLKEAATFNVINSLIMAPIIFDLKQVLLVNKTKIPFIISDNPVCITNWFCRTRPRWDGSVGITNSGTQIILPISPKHAFLLLDNNVYSTGNSKNTIELREEEDVCNINRIQYLNSYKNIYFNGFFSNAQAEAICSIEKPKRHPIFVRSDTSDGKTYYPTNKNELDAPTLGAKSELVHISFPRLAEDIRINSIKIRSKPKFYDSNSAAGPRRDPAWISIVSDFDNLIMHGIYKFSDFWHFVLKHPQLPNVGKWLKRLASGVSGEL